jgi:hypothetical protein
MFPTGVKLPEVVPAAHWAVGAPDDGVHVLLGLAPLQPETKTTAKDENRMSLFTLQVIS